MTSNELGERVSLQRFGGIAALYAAVAYISAMAYFLVALDYPNIVDPLQKVALLAEHQTTMHLAYLTSYVIFGLLLSVLSLALYERLRTGAQVIAKVATAYGLIWSTLLIASGVIFIRGMSAVVALYPSDASEAVSLWRSIESVTTGLSFADGEILGGLWTLLVSLGALRVNGIRSGLHIPRALNYLGLAVGVFGIISTVPALNILTGLFGISQIIWFVALGLVMIKKTSDGRR